MRKKKSERGRMWEVGEREERRWGGGGGKRWWVLRLSSSAGAKTCYCYDRSSSALSYHALVLNGPTVWTISKLAAAT